MRPENSVQIFSSVSSIVVFIAFTFAVSLFCLPDIDECSDEGYVCPEGYCQIINGEIKCTCDNENTLESSALCSGR